MPGNYWLVLSKELLVDIKGGGHGRSLKKRCRQGRLETRNLMVSLAIDARQGGRGHAQIITQNHQLVDGRGAPEAQVLPASAQDRDRHLSDCNSCNRQIKYGLEGGKAERIPPLGIG